MIFVCMLRLSPTAYSSVQNMHIHIRGMEREHVAFLFSEEDEEFHNLIRKHMVMPFILGDFFPCHSEEDAGGKYFAVVKPNANGALSQMLGEPLLTLMCGEYSSAPPGVVVLFVGSVR